MKKYILRIQQIVVIHLFIYSLTHLSIGTSSSNQYSGINLFGIPNFNFFLIFYTVPDLSAFLNVESLFPGT